MIKAIDNKIIVEEMKRQQTSGGIVIPSTAVDPQAYGKILSMGPDVPHYEETTNNLSEGDVIVYHKMGGQAISLGNKILCCVPYPEVYGILTDEDTLKELEAIELTPAAEVVSAAKEQQEPSLIQRV